MWRQTQRIASGGGLCFTRLSSASILALATATRTCFKDYTVAWICALPMEMAAAKSMLDETDDNLLRSPNDHNTYTLGRVCGHNVVIACLPAGVYGTNSAAAVVTQMLSTFRSIRFGLLVGIGGGVPSEEADIRLGDVVVSKPTKDFGGVVQYDYGKAVGQGRFERIGTLNKPPQSLLTAVAKLQADHMLEGSRIPDLLSMTMAAYPRMRTRFKYPGQEQDRLFDSAYDHIPSKQSCDNCDIRRLVTRPPRAGRGPAIHYGLIASGNQVMKHGNTRDEVARNLGILCFEMEAAGLMDNFPCLVVRGVCDYADSHKNKQWQEYSAATAAAYAKELLSVIPVDHVAGTPVAASVTDLYRGKPQQNHECGLSLSAISGSVEEIEDQDEPRRTENDGSTTSMAASVYAPEDRGRPRKRPLSISGDQVEVIEESYPRKEIWRSGKHKLGNASCNRSLTVLPRTLPFLIDGIETDIDRRFLEHFVYSLSPVLTLMNDDSNPYKEILLPMACLDRGLMHSLMCLSGSHLSGLDPDPWLQARNRYHFHRAIRDLKDNINATATQSDGAQVLVEDSILASIIVLSLNTICEGETHGEYRPHMDAARYLLATQKRRNDKFTTFILEVFQYYDVSNSITSLDRRPVSAKGELRPPYFIPHTQPGAFLGVFDGLFNYLSEITRLRDRIRQRSKEGYEPAIGPDMLCEAVTVDSAIRSWETTYPSNTSNYVLAQLYRQSTWVYLYRTTRPSRPDDKIQQVVDDGLGCLDQLPQDAGAYSIVLMPLFLFGCSAFLPRQRERIQQGFECLTANSNLRNIKPAFKVVQRVWEVMDTEPEHSWDWEKIINDMKMDFLIA